MRIIKESKYKKLKAYKKACKHIYQTLLTVKEDEHGNVKAYQHDKVISEILQTLKEVGIGEPTHKVIEGGWKPPFVVKS